MLFTVIALRDFEEVSYFRKESIAGMSGREAAIG